MDKDKVKEYLSLDKFDPDLYLRKYVIKEYLVNSEELSEEERFELDLLYNEKFSSIVSDKYLTMFNQFMFSEEIDMVNFIRAHSLSLILYSIKLVENLMYFAYGVVDQGFVGIYSNTPEVALNEQTRYALDAIKDNNPKKWEYVERVRIMLVDGLRWNTIYSVNSEAAIGLVKYINKYKRDIVLEVYGDSIDGRLLIDEYDLEDAFMESRTALQSLYELKRGAYKELIDNGFSREYSSLYDHLYVAYTSYDGIGDSPARRKMAAKKEACVIFEEYIIAQLTEAPNLHHLYYHTPEGFNRLYSTCEQFLNVFNTDRIRGVIISDLGYGGSGAVFNTSNNDAYIENMKLLARYGIITQSEYNYYCKR